MKILLNVVLIVTFFAEAPVGSFLVFSPESFLPAGQLAGVLWVRNYGVAALAIASLVIWTWQSRESYRTMGVTLGFLMTFHSALSIALLTSGGQLFGAVLHCILAILCILLYIQRAKWCAIEAS